MLGRLDGSVGMGLGASGIDWRAQISRSEEATADWLKVEKSPVARSSRGQRCGRPVKGAGVRVDDV